MLAETVAVIFARELRALRREIEAYPDEASIWKVVPGITNPAGTLVLHLTGNIQHYIGMRLGGSGYVRDRPAEFSRRNVPRAELLREIAQAEAAVGALPALTDRDLRNDFPEMMAGNLVNTGDVLAHLVSHFAYHLGQVDYHRRLVTGLAGEVGAVRAAELKSARPVEQSSA